MTIREYYFSNIVRHLPPDIHGTLHRLSLLRSDIRREALRKTILSFYGALPAGERTQETEEALSYLRSERFCLVPYGWCKPYLSMPVKVYRDRAKRMNYAVLDDQKVYFRRYTDKGIVRKAVRELSYEQDIRSPHRYVTDENTIIGTFPGSGAEHGHCVRPGDIVADVGAAEGIFSLSVAGTAAHIYIFECDRDWLPALEETFRDYNGKVTLVHKSVSDTEDEQSVTLDAYFKGKPDISFLKADIEGMEPKMLRGAYGLLREGRIKKASICVYHDVGHSDTFVQLMKAYGYHARLTDGFMLNRNKPYMVRGILQAYL
jgi:hypothetical protein